MSKNKVYEHDYEWKGQENESKGVNINEKNPWNKPDWGTKPKKDHSTPQSSSSVTPADHFGTMEELQRRHQWEKPDWATIQKRGGESTPMDSNKDIIKDPIPKPMLKKTVAGVASGILGASSTTTSAGSKSKNKTFEDTDREIAEMEKSIEVARQKKAVLEQQKQIEEAEAAIARQKHTVEESKLERARRLAKEREEIRWRATLAERNLRDKEQREHARLAALNKSSNTTSKTSDAVWEKTQNEQQEQYEERVRQEAKKRQETIDQEMMIAKQKQQQEKKDTGAQPVMPIASVTPDPLNTNHHDEEFEEEIIEEYTEEYEEEEYDEDEEEGTNAPIVVEGNAASGDVVDDIQRQIDALRLQLGIV